MNKAQSIAAFAELAELPAATWVGKRIVGEQIETCCTRCGARDTFDLSRLRIPSDETDAALYGWISAFLDAHAKCEAAARATGDGSQ